MRLLHKIGLSFRQGNSNKVYEVELCEWESNLFVVNFRYGRAGARLKEGTKTKDAVTQARAEAIFQKLVQEKVGKGYVTAEEFLAKGYKLPKRGEVNGAGEMADAMGDLEVGSVSPQPPKSAETSPSSKPQSKQEAPHVPQATQVSKPKTTQSPHPARGVKSRNAGILRWLDFYETADEASKAAADWPFHRVARRVGELAFKKGVPSLVALLGSENNRDNLAIVGALGRCGGKAALTALRQGNRDANTALGRAFWLNLLANTKGKEWQGLQKEARALLSRETLEALSLTSHEEVLAHVTRALEGGSVGELFALSLLADEGIRAVFLDVVCALPLTRARTQMLRELFEHAVDSSDWERTGALALRLNLKDLPYGAKGRRGWRNHLQRRWQQARERDALAGPAILEASLFAVPASYETELPPWLQGLWEKQEEAIRNDWSEVTEESWVAVFCSAPAKGVRIWAETQLRERGFFARNSWEVSVRSLYLLLASDSEEAQSTGMRWAKEGHSEVSVFFALLESPHARVKAFLPVWIDAHLETWKASPLSVRMEFAAALDFVELLLTHPRNTVREFGETLVPLMEEQPRMVMAERLVGHLCGERVLPEVEWEWLHLFETSMVWEGTQLSVDLLLALLRQPRSKTQEFAALQCLGRDSASFSNEVFAALLSSDSAVVQGVGGRILAEVPDKVLLSYRDTLLRLCGEAAPGTRQGFRPLFQRFLGMKASVRKDFTSKLLQQFTS